MVLQACQEWSVHLLRLSGMPLPRSRTGSWLPPPQMAFFLLHIFILHNSQYTTFPPDGLLAKRVPPLPPWPASWSIFHVWVGDTNIVNQLQCCQTYICLRLSTLSTSDTSTNENPKISNFSINHFTSRMITLKWGHFTFSQSFYFEAMMNFYE